MKIGTKFNIKNDDLVRALQGRIAKVTLPDEGEVTVRLINSSTYITEVQVIDPNTKE